VQGIAATHPSGVRGRKNGEADPGAGDRENPADWQEV
jgi:hypothetical protein